jgi:predicted transcriptional regulator
MSQGFFDLLFEVSNENRYEILLKLQNEAMRTTDITKEMDINRPEARRHLSRLRDLGLIERDYEGYFHLTPYGETSLLLFQEFNFLSKHSEYFKNHTLSELPTSFVKQIGELRGGMKLETPLDFIRYTENLLLEAQEHVWLVVDQFPVHLLSEIVEALGRGIEFKAIEVKERILNPNLDALTSSETKALSQTMSASLFQQRMLDKVNVFMLVSDSRCIITFLTIDKKFDYIGFTATSDSALKLCEELFQIYWEKAEPRKPVYETEIKRTPLTDDKPKGSVIITGVYRPEMDVQALQDAVDHYDEVVLNGEFNLGTSRIYINRSVVLRGEGRENNIPSTKIRKSGWMFPNHQEDFLLIVKGDGIDVTIENIHFSDFNNCCIWNWQGNSSKILNNRFTIVSGLGHGSMIGGWGDMVHAVASGGDRESGGFPGGVLIEGNYIDLADGKPYGGALDLTGEKQNPEYRPNLPEHDGFISIGLTLNNNLGKIVVRNNTIRNANSKGILITNNWDTAEIIVHNNIIFSEVYGSYAYGNPNAGFGILAQNSMSRPQKGSKVKIFDNEIHCTKKNYCGIGVYGPSIIMEGSGKLEECIIHENKIHLEDGSVGVLVRKSDYTEVSSNKFTGKAYYGIQVSGREIRDGLNLGAFDNVVEDNDFSEFTIKNPDQYSDNHIDDKMFTGSDGKSETAHVWLNSYSSRNIINLEPNEMVIDQGTDNKIIKN